MRPDRLERIVLDGRHAGELLAHPCRCDQPACLTLGQHLLQSTRDMAPGLQAQAFEPRTIRPSGPPSDDDPPPDPTSQLADQYTRLLADYQRTAQTLTRFVEAYRPDRWTPIPDPGSDDLWCRNHLDGIGLCEPRHRGDLCRACYEIGLVHGQAPDKQLLHGMRDRGYRHPRDLADFAQRIASTRPKRKRKKAS